MHHHKPRNNASGIRLAFFLNFSFTVLEIIGGLWTNSMAIIADALHDLGDSLALGLSWFLEKYSTKENDNKYSYGYRRFSLLGALASTTILVLGAIFVFSEAIPRLLQPEQANAEGMILFAVVGVLVNGLAVLRLRDIHSHNARVVAWHLLEDVLGWVAVLIVAVVLLFKDVYILDPILSILITTYVLFNVLKNLRKTLSLFLQAVPESIDLRSIEQEIKRMDKVRSTHHAHVWSLDGQNHVLSIHVLVDENTTKEEAIALKQRIREYLESTDCEHITIEIEYSDEDCSVAVNTS